MTSGIGTDASLPLQQQVDTTFQPGAREVPQPQGFFERVDDSVSLLGSLQAATQTIEMMHPTEEGYDPLKDERFKGNEQWAPWLREARSSAQFGMMLERYRRSAETHERVNANGTIWSELAAGFADPLNYLAPGSMGGRGILRGAVEAGLINGVASVPIGQLTRAVDPNAPREGILEEMFYSTAIGGVLGGIAGGLGRVGEAMDYHSTVGRLSRELVDQQAYRDGLLNPVFDADGTPQMPARTGRYEARPSDGNEGWAPTGIGLEKLTGAGGILNPLMTSVGWAVQSGHRALQDLALQMGGDLGMKLKDNQVGVATPTSAYLDSGRWRAVAADTMTELYQAYSEYLGKPNPLQLAGVNVSTQGARMGGAMRKLVGKQRADGKLEFNDWLEEIVLAHRKDRLEPNLSKHADQSEEAKASVLKGAGIVRKFFDKADQEATGAGFVKEQTGAYLGRRFEIFDRNEARIAELQAKPERTANEDGELRYRAEVVRPRVAGKIPERAHLQRRYDRLRQQWTEGRAAGMSREDMAGIDAQLRELELQGVGQRRVGAGPAVTQGPAIQPTASELPPAAANENPPGEVVSTDGEVFEIAPFRDDDGYFNAPANDPGITVDKWEDRDLSVREEGGTLETLSAHLVQATKSFEEPSKRAVAILREGFEQGYLTPEQKAELAGEVQIKLPNELDDLPDDEALWISNILARDTTISKIGDPVEQFIALQAKLTVMAVDRWEIALGHAVRGREVVSTPRYETGRALLADTFHGTKQVFTDFDPAKAGTGAGGADTRDGVIYSARHPDTTNDYSGMTDWELSKGMGSEFLAPTEDEVFGPEGKRHNPNVIMSRVRMDNPLVFDNLTAAGWNASRNNMLIDDAKTNGHDGVVILNTRDGGPTDVIYIAFSPEQMRYRFDPAQAQARANAAKAKDVFTPPTLAGLANDNTPPPTKGGLPDAVPAETRLDDGSLPNHELVAANDNADLGGPKADPYYLPRRWDNESVRTNPDGLRAAFDRWHDEVGKKRLADEEWSSILANILQGEVGRARPDFRGDPTGGHFRHGRKLDIPNEYVTDYVERNAGSLVLDYANRFGPGLEVHKRFGERDAMDAIDEAVIQAMRERQGSVDDLLRFAEEATGHFQYIRDQTLGDLHKDDPLSLTKVAVETAKAYTSTVLLGKVVFSQMVELARPLMTHGFIRNFQFITDNMIGNVGAFEKAGRDLRSIVGEGFDTVLGLSVQRMLEVGDLNRPGSSMAHRTRAALQPFMNFAHGPWYIMNLMGPVTDLTKNYMMVMTSHFLIDDIAKLVAGKASQKTTENLLALGVDLPFAREVMGLREGADRGSQKIEKNGRLNLANLGEWDDQGLANRFASAIRGEVNRAINTPGPQSKSAIAQGFLTRGDGRRQWALVTLPFQFMSWGLSAAQKISMSALQGRDANALGGTAALIGTAYLAQWLKTDQASWDKTPLEERVFRAVDSSGVAGIVGSLNSMVETGTQGTLGLRPAFGMEPGFGQQDGVDAAGAWGGPVGSRVADAYKMFTDPSLDSWQRASIARRAIPTSGLFYTDSLWKGMQSGLMDQE